MSLTQAVDLLLRLLTRHPELFLSMLHDVVIEQVGHSIPNWRTQGQERIMYHDMITVLMAWRTKMPRDDDPTEPRIPPVTYETPDEEP